MYLFFLRSTEIIKYKMGLKCLYLRQTDLDNLHVYITTRFPPWRLHPAISFSTLKIKNLSNTFFPILTN